MKISKSLWSALSTDFRLRPEIFYSFFFISALCYGVFIWNKRKTYFSTSNTPGPLNLPLIGYGYRLLMVNSDGKLNIVIFSI